MPVKHSPPAPVAFVTGILKPKPGLCGKAGGLVLVFSAELKWHCLFSAILGTC